MMMDRVRRMSTAIPPNTLTIAIIVGLVVAGPRVEVVADGSGGVVDEVAEGVAKLSVTPCCAR